MFDPQQILIPPELPIAERELEILDSLRRHQVVIVRGETGSGKTTQLPKLCLKAGIGGRGLVGCTQPRRVAALSVAERIAEELGVEGRRIVGTKIRFTDQTNRNTRIKVMTDGILLNEMQHDPLLRRYAAIVVDEAHERSLNIDFILGHLIQMRFQRPDLKILITSATIDTAQFSAAFGGAPVIEVTGRMYPVEVRYRPFEECDRGGDYTYIEACCDAVEEVTATTRAGDVLAFMPAEKDIREVCDQLAERLGQRVEIVPLYGRLSHADQLRIFRPVSRRKVVVATNIAETSITVPGIKFVIDSGLARISRFSAHSRTQRLPIEAISRSSANQRMGRCGRVSEGVCIRLYSEEDFLSRPEFTPPEILRSNLASVILRLKAFRFGTIEDFPFLDRPDPRAIQGGLILLKELCALDDVGELTETGHKLARLPIDPTIGRMLLEAQQMGVQRAVLIIASALAIQDPRERPLEKEKEADLAHQKFKVEGSDFLTLLKIWTDFDDKYEKWSQGAMRRFCREHYMSYQRLREWREIHQQIGGVLEDMEAGSKEVGKEDADAVHRSILSGLIGNVAFWEEGNWYQATRGRKVLMFPGSGLFRKTGRPGKGGQAEAQKNREAAAKKEWIMAAEFVETTRLFARTAARIEPSWVMEAGAHLLRVSYVEPHWSSRSQRVLAWKKSHLYGLLVGSSRAGFGEVDAAKAKEIFIQSALMEEGIRDRFDFVEHNRKVVQDVTELQIRLRRSLVLDLETRVYAFYDERLPMISSVAELHKWWRSLPGESRKRIFLDPSDLMEQSASEQELNAYPKEVDLGGVKGTIRYHFEPGSKLDGATLRVPLEHFAGVQEGSLDWLVPGYVESKVEQLLRNLPKEYRRFLSPAREKAAEILRGLQPTPHSLLKELSARIEQLYGLRIPLQSWELRGVSEYLRPAIEVVDEQSGAVVGRSRDWGDLHERVNEHLQQGGSSLSVRTGVQVWKEACEQWERKDVKGWSFGDVPASLELGMVMGVPLYAFPSLVLNSKGEVELRLMKTREQALRYTPAAYRKLCEWASGREVGWFVRDLKHLKGAYIAFSDTYVWDDFAADLESMVLGSLFAQGIQWPLLQGEFERKVEAGKVTMRTLPMQLRDLLDGIGRLRMELLNGNHAKHPVTLQALQRLMPGRFLRIYSVEQLRQLPRYLKANQLRMQRAVQHPLKDREKQARLEPILRSYADLMKLVPGSAQICNCD
jgi:ATP-dependent helicase HrpA